MSTIRYSLCLLLLCTFAAGAASQPESVSMTLGIVRGIDQGFHTDSPSLPFGEVEAEFGLFDPEESAVSFSAALHAGVWREKAPDPPGCADCVIYSFTTPTYGVRAISELHYFPLPLSVVVGYSRHHVLARYAHGSDILGNRGSDYSYAFGLIEFAARLAILDIGGVQTGIEVQRYVDPESDRNRRANSSWRFGVRASVQLD